MSTYNDWEDFCNYLIYSNRYILDEKRQKIADEIIGLARLRENTLKKDSLFWRARIAKNLRVVNNEIIVDRYKKEEMMVPPVKIAKEGRANPQGISYLYMSEKDEAAIAEIKPYLGARIDLISIRLKKDIKVVNIHEKTSSLFQLLQESEKKEIDYLWFGVRISFAVPLAPEDKLGYIPTQYIAELFKNKGYEGILFESVQSAGNLNLVLFDPSNVEPLEMSERIIHKIEYIDNVKYIKQVEKFKQNEPFMR